MNDLIVKEVDFNGDVIKAVQDTQGIIWVGVSWVCNGIGMNRNMKNRQVKNIQSDIVIKRGCVKFDAGVFDPNNATLAIQLDYIPLWLAKVSITPMMQEELPELVNKLVMYQLQAKDVLAAAFLSKQKSETEALRAEIKELKELIQSKFDRWNADMSKVLELFLRTQSIASVDSPKKIPVQRPVSKEYQVWKEQVYSLVAKIMESDCRYKQSRAVLLAAYRRMRNVYGFVYEQAEKEYKERHGDCSKPSTIEVIYDSDTYRSLLVPILKDMLESVEVKDDQEEMDSIIEPLVRKRNDKSPNHCAIYRSVFAEMERNGFVSWGYHIMRYQNTYFSKKTPGKKIIVAESQMLMKKFSEAVDRLLKE